MYHLACIPQACTTLARAIRWARQFVPSDPQHMWDALVQWESAAKKMKKSEEKALQQL